MQAALDVDLAALGQILARDLGKPLPEHHVVPFRALFPLSVLLLLYRSFVATVIFATGTPLAVYFNSGSFPRLPIRMTLLTDLLINFTSLFVLAPLLRPCSSALLGTALSCVRE